jgi:hypothetical protein
VAPAEGLTSQLWTLAGAVVAPAVFGAGLVRVLGLSRADGLRVCAAWSFLVGQLALAAMTLLWLIAGQPVPGPALAAAALLAGGAILWRRGTGPARPQRTRKGRWIGIVTLVLIAFVVDRCLLHNLEPVTVGDEAEIWAAKAKVLYGSPGFDLRFGLSSYAVHPDYPLFDPLVQVLSFANAGTILQFENRLPMQGFAVALLLLLSAELQRRCSLAVTLMVLTAVTASSFLVFGITCYADVMLAGAMLSTAAAWLRWQETGERRWWALCCIALAAALSAKNEGSLLAAAALGAVVLARLLRRTPGPALPLRAWCWLGVPLAAVLVHRGFNAWFALTNDLVDPQLGGGRGLFGRMADLFGERACTVAKFYGSLLLDQPIGRLLVPLFLLAAVSCGRQLRRAAVLPLLLFVVFALLGYMLVFVGTNADLQWHLQTAANRTVLHVLPVAALGLGMALGHARSGEPSVEAW